jgi:hypothetical protein
LRSVQHLRTNEYDEREKPSVEKSNEPAWPMAVEFVPRRDDLRLKENLLGPTPADHGTIRIVGCNRIAAKVSARLDLVYLRGSHVTNAANQ